MMHNQNGEAIGEDCHILGKEQRSLKKAYNGCISLNSFLLLKTKVRVEDCDLTLIYGLSKCN